MRIGIIGAGSLGQALGERFAATGHEVMFGGLDSARQAADRLGAFAGTNADAAAFGEVVVLAVPFAAVCGALTEAGSLADRIVWSCVNALKRDLSGLAVGYETSAAEHVAQRIPHARVVAAIPPFAQAIAAGDLHYDRELEPTVFVCGDDSDAKAIVSELLVKLGTHPVDAGPLTMARLVEPAMMLMVSLAYSGLPRDVGLRLLERVRPPAALAAHPDPGGGT